MSLKDVDIKTEYRTLVENITRDFYVPLLSEANLYKRAVGFFSSTALIKLSVGINRLVKNGGSVKLIVTPHLNDEDVAAIRQGYKDREEIIRNALVRELREPRNTFQEKHLNMLSNLIADSKLDIRVALTKTASQYGMYHEKVGIIQDCLGNKVAFSGSMNESANAFESNYETIDVYTSWSTEAYRVEAKESAFDRIWEGMEPNIDTKQFVELKDEIIRRYKKKKIDYEKGLEDEELSVDLPHYDFFEIPHDVDLYDYQKQAIEKWFEYKCSGIYDMATGTGKTYTALASVAKLSQSLEEKLAVIIVVPYQHLVEQWVDDLKRFNVLPIKAYSYPGQKWREEFNSAVLGYNAKAIDHFCVVATIASFKLDDFQSILSKMRRDFCFVADEAHNLGTDSILEALPRKARYRLALSATLERYGDPVGTQKIREYFGNTCISFSLGEAIQKRFLTSYYYYPVVVCLSNDELEDYQQITEKISRMIAKKKGPDDPALKALLMRRSRIVAGCYAKIDKLIEVVTPYRDKNNILVYCGATTYDFSIADDQKLCRQIEDVNFLLYNELKMKVRKFTAEENAVERAEIKQMFKAGEIQAITAIKCLDEGVNIPAIKTAFILASSTNPKEYIQRRGRVLRIADNKEYAEIYDFITLPRPLNEVKYCNAAELKMDYSLISREFNRVIEFSKNSRNPADSDKLIHDIENVYSIEMLQNGGSDYVGES